MKRIIILATGFLMVAATLFAGSGDLIVNGNLGVGTTGPSAPLQVVGTNNPDGQSQILQITPAGDITRKLFLGYNTAADVGIIGAVQTGIGFKNVAFPTGNVGIGTTSPVSQTEISGTSPYLTLSNSLTDVPIDSTLGILNFHSKDTSTQSSGGVGSIRVYSETAYNTGATPSYMTFYTHTNTGNDGTTLGNPTEKMRITAAGYIGIGTTNPGYKLDVQGQVASNGQVLTSDMKFKKNIAPVNSALAKILEMNGVTFNWRTDEYKDKGFSEGRHYGVIAQEIEKVLPEVVIQDGNGDKAVAYNELIPILIEAVKEQQKEIDTLKVKQASMEQQQALISALYEKVNAMEKQVNLQGTVARVDN